MSHFENSHSDTPHFEKVSQGTMNGLGKILKNTSYQKIFLKNFLGQRKKKFLEKFLFWNYFF